MHHLNNRHSIAIHFFSFLRCSLSLVLLFIMAQTAVKAQQTSQDPWRFESQRAAIAPVHFVDKEVLFEGEPTLALQGGGKSFADGRWSRTFDVEPGQYYRFDVHFKASGVDEPNRSILARIKWQDDAGEAIGFTEYPMLLRDTIQQDWRRIDQTYLVPAGVKKAKIELHYRWDEDGSVNFGGIHFNKTAMPESRHVKLATVGYRPRNTKSSMENLEIFAGYVAKVAALKADIVCLPEGATLVGTDLNYISASEPVPGPTTAFLGKVAAQHHIYIVAGLLEKEGDVVYNTSVLIDRQGKLAGKYRKLSLPREEIDGGVTPGNTLPVFDTDFGRIGMMICWDVTFPETARNLAMKGAEVILLPIWGGNVTLASARAIENQVYLVSSSYDMVSAVFGKEGEIIKETTNAEPFVVVDVDLSAQKLWPWLGDFRNRIPTEMPPKTAFRD